MVEIDFNKYKNIKILLIGVGATGSQLTPFLCQMLNNYTNINTDLLFIDEDIISKKNLKNQKFMKEEVGEFKSRILAERYKLVYPDLNVKYIDKYITSKGALTNLVEKLSSKIADEDLFIILGCVDNIASRKVLNEFFNSTDKNLIYIDSGNGTDIREGQVVVGVKLNNRVLQEPVGALYNEILTDTSGFKELYSCGEVLDKNPQNIATNVLAATTIFTILNELFYSHQIKVHEVLFDAENTFIKAINRKVG